MPPSCSPRPGGNDRRAAGKAASSTLHDPRVQLPAAAVQASETARKNFPSPFMPRCIRALSLTASFHNQCNPRKPGTAFIPPHPANLKAGAFIHSPGGNRVGIRGDDDFFRPPFHDSLKRLPELHPAIPVALAGGDNAIVAYLHVFGHLSRVPRRQPGGLAIQDSYKTVLVRNLRVIKEKSSNSFQSAPQLSCHLPSKE